MFELCETLIVRNSGMQNLTETIDLLQRNFSI